MSLPPELPESAQSGGGLPVCPRHPDTVSYVRCQRCERPTCPACQRPAPVGVQCVDCVREHVRAQNAARGGRRPDGSIVPLVTFTLIGLNVLSYVLQLAVPGWTDALVLTAGLALEEPYRVLTSAFLHSEGSFIHILFNMYLLWMVGPIIESRFGRVRFLALYLLAAIGGSVGYVLFLDATSLVAWQTRVVGASGAVFGLLGASLLALPRSSAARSQIIGLLVLNGVLGFVLPGIAWEAHLGGLVVGAGLGWAFTWVQRSRERAQRIMLTVGVVVAVSLVLTMLGDRVLDAKYEALFEALTRV